MGILRKTLEGSCRFYRKQWIVLSVNSLSNNYKKGGGTMERKNRLARSLLITLLFFTVNAFFVMPVHADETELLATREIAIKTIDKAFQELAENTEEYQKYIAMAAEYLPEDSINALNGLVFVAQLDISTEEKLDALIEISQTNCSTYARIWLVGWCLEFIPILDVFSSLLTTIGWWGLILCLLGII